MQKSYLSIYAALIANLLISATKFIAGFISNSSAMVSEGIHSLVDTINEVLLLWGIKQSNKPKDKLKPFGYGRELFFWSFVVSVLIFGLGGGISIYQGISHMLHPLPHGNPFWSYVVLFASLLFESISFIIAAKAFNKIRNGQPWWDAIINSKDPGDFLVLFEDGAAVIGLLVVMVCVWLGQHYNIAYLDGLASLIVGILLVFVSIVLARESRSLLMGEGIAKATKLRIITIAETDNDADKVMRLFSTYMGPNEILLMMDIQFSAHLNTSGVHDAIDRIRTSIKKEFPKVKYLMIQPDIIQE